MLSSYATDLYFEWAGSIILVIDLVLLTSKTVIILNNVQ